MNGSDEFHSFSESSVKEMGRKMIRGMRFKSVPDKITVTRVGGERRVLEERKASDPWLTSAMFQELLQAEEKKK